MDPKTLDDMLNDILHKARTNEERAWVARRLWHDAAKVEPDESGGEHILSPLLKEIWGQTDEKDRIRLSRDLSLLVGSADVRLEE